MPIYEYACRACGHEFEIIQRISEREKRKCPECSELALEKLISRTSFVLKGGGWYADGYGGEAETAGENGEGAKKGKTDTKKAEKAPGKEAEKKADPAPAKAGGSTAAKKASSGGS